MATEILLHGRKVRSVFDLLGTKENDITYSLGWALAHSPTLRQALLTHVLGKAGLDATTVRLQERIKGGGITDIELIGEQVHVVVEAKRGWARPGIRQLELYGPRLTKENRPNAAIVTMSQTPVDMIGNSLPAQLGRFPIKHVSWRQVQEWTGIRARKHAEQRLLVELGRYLQRIVKMQKQDTNWVMTVAISNTKPRGYGLTFREIVQQKNMYFHPAKRKYSDGPATYVGFRWNGHLQAIHHVESYVSVTNIKELIPELNPGKWNTPHYVYTLGPSIPMGKALPNGDIYAPGPVWAMLDLLLTSRSVAEARKLSNKREGLDKQRT